MTLAPGTVLGPYEIAGQIGAGGMGEVYRARDTKLERDVALKILPDAFTGDLERIARFQLEAKVLASLNHPNIAAIYGLEDGEATRALVLELVEGPTLADRIAQGPIPVDEALRIAQQIAEALEAAHEQGIVHRDLKPANIKLRPDGTVKVLDFGLAKALEGERTQAEQSNSPTLTAAASQMGVIMGTAAYMSPEQARGKPADRRADIWAFGVVLFEMLTGQRAFEGEDASLTLADVMRAEPKWERLPDGFSPGLHTYLRRCLNKDPKQRVQAIGDVRLAMEGAFESMAARPPDVIAGRAQPAPWQHPATIAAMLLATAVLTGLGVRTLSPPAAAPFTRTSIVLPRTQVTDSRSRGVAISPDGTHISYAANGQLYLRALDQLDSVPLTGSEERGATSPFFSPDGQWIGFFSVGSLKKVPLSGGAAVTVAELNAGFNVSATWGVNDTIVVSAGLRVFRVAGTGGPLEELLAVEPPAFVRQPQILPGGEALLYTFDDFAGAGYWEASEIVVRNLATGERTVLVEGGTDARYLSTGHLVYSLGSTLFAVPFDPDRLELTGGPVPLVEGVNRTGTGATNADISRPAHWSTCLVATRPGSRPAHWSGSIARDARRSCRPRRTPICLRACHPMALGWRSVPSTVSRISGSGNSHGRL